MKNNLPTESKIFVPNKLNDFEKLLFAQRAIKDLQTENRILYLENEALKRTAKNFDELFTANDAEKRQFKADKFYKNIQLRLLEVSAKVRRLKKDKQELLSQLAMLKNKQN